MFTGIIEEVGSVRGLARGARTCVLEVRARAVLADVRVGDSIAVNGVCLTVTSFTQSSFTADVMNETLARSSLDLLRAGDAVNLERALAADGRFGGHIVSGHIDGVGTVLSVREDGNAVWFRIRAERAVSGLVVEKGSVAVEGISLTVAEVDEDGFSVSVIPHTRSQTNLAFKGAGDTVNIETDVVGKYVARLLGAGALAPDVSGPSASTGSSAPSSAGITWDFLSRNGF